VCVIRPESLGVECEREGRGDSRIVGRRGRIAPLVPVLNALGYERVCPGIVTRAAVFAN
jgi:hypothetical protein